MLREFFRAKIHRAVVTEADLNYEGSLTVDADILKASKLDSYEKVLIVNANNGKRFETYLIKGEAGSKQICLNGPAARLGLVGDVISIIAFVQLESQEIESHRVINVLLDGKSNQIVKIDELD